MSWPGQDEFRAAIQNPRRCFCDPELLNGRPVADRLGLPKVASGNFASVYELEEGDRRWAVRCFSRQVKDQQRRYRLISERLGSVHIPQMVDFEYVSQGIRVNGSWYPIVKMAWVDSETLLPWIREHRGDRVAVHQLAKQWRYMVASLQGLGIAHADLQHGNVLITSTGELKLIDYDGMYVPAMSGEEAPEVGERHWSHPQRNRRSFGPYLDQFPGLVGYLSLLAIAERPELFDRYHDETLLLHESDFRDPLRSSVIAELTKQKAFRDPAVSALATKLADWCSKAIDSFTLEQTIASAGEPVLEKAGPALQAQKRSQPGATQKSAKPTTTLTPVSSAAVISVTPPSMALAPSVAASAITPGGAAAALPPVPKAPLHSSATTSKSGSIGSRVARGKGLALLAVAGVVAAWLYLRATEPTWRSYPRSTTELTPTKPVSPTGTPAASSVAPVTALRVPFWDQVKNDDRSPSASSAARSSSLNPAWFGEWDDGRGLTLKIDKSRLAVLLAETGGPVRVTIEYQWTAAPSARARPLQFGYEDFSVSKQALVEELQRQVRSATSARDPHPIPDEERRSLLNLTPSKYRVLFTVDESPDCPVSRSIIDGDRIYELSGCLDGAAFSRIRTFVRRSAADEKTKQDKPAAAVSEPSSGETLGVSSTPSAVWTKQFGSTAPDVATSIAADAIGHIYVAGWTGGAFGGKASNGGDDAFLQKIDSNGDLLWIRQYGSSAHDRAQDVATDSSGAVYVVGYTGGAMSVTPSLGSNDAFLEKRDSSGERAWIRQFGTPANDLVGGLALDTGGNAYVVGWTTGAFDGTTNSGGLDVFVVKFDNNGKQLWARQFGSSADDVAYAAACSPEGDLYLAGWTKGSVDSNFRNPTGFDWFVSKIDFSGQMVWTKQFGASGYPLRVAVDPSSGDVYVAGHAGIPFGGNATSGGQDALVVKINSSGNLDWVRQFGTAQSDVASGIAIGRDGDVFVAGSFGASFEGNQSAGGTDVFIVRMNASGDRMWTKQFGSAANDYSPRLVAMPGNTLAVAGVTHGSLSGENFGGEDFFVAKFNVASQPRGR